MMPPLSAPRETNLPPRPSHASRCSHNGHRKHAPLAEQKPSRQDVDLLGACDEVLVHQALGGDKQAYVQLVERHQRAAFGVVLSLVGNRTMAEDVAQDAFVTGWAKLRSLRDGARFRPWVCHIARNLARAVLRKRKPMVEPPEQLADDDGEDVERELSEQQEAALVRKLLTQLPEKNRQALVLYYLEEQSLDQVASALGLERNAVEQRLSRGRKQLQQRVEALLERDLARKGAALGLAAVVVSRLGEAQAAPPMATTGWAWGAAAVVTIGVVGAAWRGEISAPAAGYELGEQRGEPESAAPMPSAMQAPAREAWSASASHEQWLDRIVRRDAAREDVGAEVEYELTTLKSGLVAVSLLSGAVDENDPDIIKMVHDQGASTRTLTGRVIDAEGRGVRASVVVNGGGFLHASTKFVQGHFGTMTDEQGRFSIEAPNGEVLLLALRSSAAWSEPLRVAAGEAAVTGLELELVQPGRLTGSLTYGGAPVRAGFMVMSANGGMLVISRDSGRDDGTFGEALLPPGDYVVTTFRAGDAADEAAPPQASKKVSVKSGERVHVELALKTGTLVAVQLTRPAAAPEDEGRSSGDVFLFASASRVEDAEAYQALQSEMEAASMAGKSAIRWMQSDQDVIEFDDVEPGEYNACARLTDAFGTVACQRLSIAEGAEVVPVVVDLTGSHGGHPFPTATTDPSDDASSAR